MAPSYHIQSFNVAADSVFHFSLFDKLEPVKLAAMMQFSFITFSPEIAAKKIINAVSTV